MGSRRSDSGRRAHSAVRCSSGAKQRGNRASGRKGKVLTTGAAGVGRVRGKGKEEGWAGRAGALGQGGKRAGGRGRAGWARLLGFGLG